MEDSEITNEYLTVAGYRDGVLKFDSSFAEIESPRVISYTADTLPGNSGGPVFLYEGQDVNAIAINVASSDVKKKNFGRRINGWLFDQMEQNGVFY